MAAFERELLLRDPYFTSMGGSLHPYRLIIGHGIKSAARQDFTIHDWQKNIKNPPKLKHAKAIWERANNIVTFKCSTPNHKRNTTCSNDFLSFLAFCSFAFTGWFHRHHWRHFELRVEWHLGHLFQWHHRWRNWLHDAGAIHPTVIIVTGDICASHSRLIHHDFWHIL